MKKDFSIMGKIGIIFLTWRRYLQRSLNPYKITLKQFYVLEHLSRKEFLNPSQIADMLFCDRPTVTVIIKNMEGQGWIRREQDPQNAKQTKIYLTMEGKDKLQQLKDMDEKEEKSRFDPLACFSEEEMEQLKFLLNKLRNHLKEIENK